MDIQPYPIQMFWVIPGSSWVEGNQVGFGYYPNFVGRVWVLPKPDPYSKNVNFFLSQSSMPLLKHTNTIRSTPFKKKKKKTLEQPRSIVMRENTIREGERNQRERRQSIFKIMRKNRIRAFCDVPKQSEKVIRVGHG